MTAHSVSAPTPDDAAVEQVWRGLDLPGLVDVHTHFMPRRVMDAVWRYFDAQGPLIGQQWPITYRGDEADRLARLRAMGVRVFTAMLYPHKPGMAASLNSWGLQFGAEHPDVLTTCTFFPEPGAVGYVTDAIAAGARVFKCHLQVGGFDPRDPLLDDVWGVLAEAGVPVVTHAGSGPVPGAFTGPGPFAEVLAAHPRLPVVLAHMGMPEYAQFLDLAQAYDQVRFDTTMAFTPFAEQTAPFPVDRREQLRELGLAGRVLLGSDYPNIPYPYAVQVDSLVRLDLGEDWLREVLWGAGARLFSVEA